MKKKVGMVTLTERDEVQRLFERQNGLKELAKILTNNDQDLYNRIVTDLGHTSIQLQAWWDRMSKEYHWEGRSDGRWEIDFETCDIYLIV